MTPAPGTGAEAGGVSILVVEDEPMVREVAARMLGRLGHSVSVCQDGEEAVAHYQEHWRGIDLVILDLLMPRLDGEETFLRLQAINPEVVVLLSSGYSIDGKAQRVIDAGARAFIQKPFRKAELSAKISEALRGQPGSEAPR